MRAFFCLDMGPGLKEQLSTIARRLRRLPAEVKWVAPENMHVTLVFLGEIDRDLVASLEGVGRQAVAASGIDGPIEWKMDRLGAFPHLGKPRVVWVGSSEEPEAVQRLVSALQDGLEPLGFEPERRPFTTHVTLGRVKERGGSPNLRVLSDALAAHEPFSIQARVRKLTLMESRLSPQGPSYEPVFQVPFGSELS